MDSNKPSGDQKPAAAPQQIQLVQQQQQIQPASQPQQQSQPQIQPSKPQQLQPTSQSQPPPHSQPQIQVQTFNQTMTQGQPCQTGAPGFSPRPGPGIRPHGEVVYLLATNPRQPGGMPVRYPFIPIQRHPMMAPRATILQQPAVLRAATHQGIVGLSPMAVPTSQTLGIGGIHQANIVQPAAARSQMTQYEALGKGMNFFNHLLTKTPVKEKPYLIQDLIDGKMESSDFAAAIQKEMNSAPQAQLVPFLELLLPNLRQSMSSGLTKIPGIRPPLMQVPPLPGVSTPDTSTLSISSPSKVQSSGSTSVPPAKKKTPLAPGQKSAWALKKEAREAKKKERELAAQGIKQEPKDEKDSDKSDKPARPKADKPKRQDKQKKQEKQLESLASALRDDDDVNDVAAMGGVNLAEESQRIMASGAELVGTQIRSCKDEPFLDTEALTARIAKIAKEYNLSEPSKEVVTLISHSTQERLKNIVERLGILADHRSENLKFNSKYEILNDTKGQMKFLAELDRIEKRRYEEQERELLLRVAKSRSKVEDPEQQKLRQKAKDMQRAEQEEVRQREANETALLAIGPRKRLKPSSSSSVGSFSQTSGTNDIKSSAEIRSAVDSSFRRTKRVNMRDLQVLLELDRTHLDRLVKLTAQ